MAHSTNHTILIMFAFLCTIHCNLVSISPYSSLCALPFQNILTWIFFIFCVCSVQSYLFRLWILVSKTKILLYEGRNSKVALLWIY
jgi:hypothetical protein